MFCSTIQKSHSIVTHISHTQTLCWANWTEKRVFRSFSFIHRCIYAGMLEGKKKSACTHAHSNICVYICALVRICVQVCLKGRKYSICVHAHSAMFVCICAHIHLCTYMREGMPEREKKICAYMCTQT